MSKYEATYLNTLPNDWDELSSNGIGGGIYFSSKWINIHKNLHNQELMCIAIRSKDGKLMAGQYFFINKGSFGRQHYSHPPLTAYHGFAYIKNEAKYPSKHTSHYLELCSLLFSIYKEIKNANYNMIFSPDITDIRPFLQTNFNESIHYTYILSLDSMDTTKSLLSHSVRKSLKKELYIKEDDYNYDTLFSLYKMVFDKQGIQPPVNKEYFTKLIQELVEINVVKLFTAYTNNEAIAFRISLVDETEILHDWIAGSDPAYNKLAPNVNLLWEVIEFGYKIGKKQLDLNGADIPNVAKFKSEFGGKLSPYYELSKNTSKIGKVIDSVKKIFKS